MNTTAQHKKGPKLGSTQKFTGIEDIADEVVVLHGGNACLIIEIQASNFALLSREEQQAKIFAYASFLNSLTSPVQIVIRNKKIDISSYINLLNQQSKEAATLHENLTDEGQQSIVAYIRQYRDFIQELVKVNSVLDKKFYIVLSYSYLEKGIKNAVKGSKDSAFLTAAQSSLRTKADAVMSQISRLSLRAKILEKEELAKLFYEIYNPTHPTSTQLTQGVGATVITAPPK